MARPAKTAIKTYLAKRDPVLRPLLDTLAYPVARRNRDVYANLVRSIISQQLSIKAAATIHSRVLALFPNAYPEPARLSRMRVSRLRSAGLSERKAAYLRAIARYALEQGLDYQELSAYSDAQLIDKLTQIHGVGRWTVEMLLIFSFARPDVLSLDDVGIQNALKGLYGLTSTGRQLKQEMQTIAEPWRPYRSIVCRYLWRWKDLKPDEV